MSKLNNRYTSFSSAMKRLKEAIDIYDNDNTNEVLLDGTIQRFEFCVELGWKLLKDYLEYEKFGEFNSPRLVVKEAYKFSIIKDGEKWLEMLDDRNLTSHTYDEQVAKEIYNNIKSKYYSTLEELNTVMKRGIQDEE